MVSVLVALLALAAPDVKVEKTDPDAIDGDWQLVSATRDGKAAPAGELSGTRYVFKKDARTVAFYVNQDPEAFAKVPTATYKIDAAKQPAEIDMTDADGPLKGMTARGIFNIKGDELTLCISQAGKARPGKFESTDKTTSVLVFKRIKK